MGIQVIQYDMKPQPLSHDELKKLKVGDRIKVRLIGSTAEGYGGEIIKIDDKNIYFENSIISYCFDKKTGKTKNGNYEIIDKVDNINKVQIKMADPGKLGVTPKRNLEPLSKEELKNLKLGDELLIYRQATDQVYQVKIIKIFLDSSMFWVTNDRIQSQFNMETGISTSKEWVACKSYNTGGISTIDNKLFNTLVTPSVKTYTKLMSYDELNRIIQPELPTNYQRLSKQQYHQILEPHFRFIRDEKNHPYATICQLTIITPSQRIDRATGIAVCSEKDQFNRQVGKQLAYKRAIIALNSKQNSYKINRTDSDRTYELMAQDYDYKSFYEEGL